MKKINPLMVEIFTDGACKGNPGPGGWGALLRYGEHEKKIFGAEIHTTNNRMELMAVIKALESLKRASKIILTTDSQYVKNGMTNWISQWKKNQWKTKDKKNIKNEDLWKTLDQLALQHEISWQWVKSHRGHRENEIADKLANHAVELLLSKTVK